MSTPAGVRPAGVLRKRGRRGNNCAARSVIYYVMEPLYMGNREMRCHMKRSCMLLLALCLLVGLLAGCGTDKPASTAQPTASGAAPEIETLSLRFAASYQEVYDALQSAQENMKNSSYRGPDSTVDFADAAATEGAGDLGAAGEAGTPYYSGTNVQVAGVDEGDIVKTDGEYLYILREYELIIMQVNGADVEEVSHTMIGQAWDREEYEDGGSRSREKSPFALYLTGDRVVALSTYYDWSESADGSYGGTNYIAVDIYDISDRAAPKLIKSLGQDGYHVASRMIDDKLFLCTSYYADEMDDGDERTYAPCLYTDGEPAAVDCGTIGLLPTDDSLTYAVVTSYDVAAASVVTTQSILGGGDTVYMNTESLYFCRNVYSDDAGESTQEAPYTVTPHTTSVSTTVNRFAVSDGALTYAGTCSVPGGLNNQFSLDEYNGYLRLVTTEERFSYKIYVDESHNFENYERGDEYADNDLFVLDADLNVVGGVTGLAEDEYIYSARFDGDYGYLCTYRTVDPIFAVNLSDPANPTVVGAVELPGYSDYLHVWEDGLLFGLGMQTQEIESEEGTSARLDGMKMVMIDTSDPANLKEQSTLNIDADYSEALSNHKAILVDSARNLIAFPAEGSYLVYSYTPDGGFQQEKEIAVSEWDWNNRGLYIGDYFYVIGSDRVNILDLNTLENVGEAIITRG